jgi:hypothetical protein
VNRFRSRVFIGLPCPTNTAGRRGSATARGYPPPRRATPALGGGQTLGLARPPKCTKRGTPSRSP